MSNDSERAGLGVSVRSGSNITIQHNTFEDLLLNGMGGALYLETTDSSFFLFNNIF